MNSFKDIAYIILKEAGKPLHNREITKIALGRGLRSVGKTPGNTMEAIITVDIKKYKEKSRFIRTGPATFFINKNWRPEWEKVYKVTARLSPKQKGDIAENRIAEVILLYGEHLSCYKPISDDEGIDLIVKSKKTEKVYFIQVKSVWVVGGPVVAVVKKRSLQGRKNIGIVFCTFNTEEGEMNDFLWFVPVGEFIKMATYSKKYDRYVFVAGRSQRETNRWNRYLFDKRDLGKQILVMMKMINS